MKHKISIILAIVLAIFMTSACTHRQELKPVDYAKITVNDIDAGLKIAEVGVTKMKEYPDEKVRSKYREAVKILLQAERAAYALTSAVVMWEETGKKPTDLTALKANAYSALSDIIDLLKDLGVIK